jgi:hypothetical protein
LAGDQKEILQNYNIVPRSKLFSGWTNNVIGNVTAITPTSMTVEKNGEKLVISIVASTKIERNLADAKGAVVDSKKPVSFSDIKTGENVVVIVSVNDKGDLTAERVFLLPLLPPPPPASQKP